MRDRRREWGGGAEKGFAVNDFKPTPIDDAHGEEGHVQSTDVNRTSNVQTGVWTDVRAGQRTAEGTYVDDAGVLRDSDDHSVVAWHFKPRGCTRRGLTPEELVYHPDTNAPWCPECWPDELVWERNEARKNRRTRLPAEAFGGAQMNRAKRRTARLKKKRK